MKNAPLEALRQRPARCCSPSGPGLEIVLKVRLLPVPRGPTVVAWCVVLLPHNWCWDERHRCRVVVLQNATVNVAVDLARFFDKERAQELWRCLPTETR